MWSGQSGALSGWLNRAHRPVNREATATTMTRLRPSLRADMYAGFQRKERRGKPASADARASYSGPPGLYRGRAARAGGRPALGWRRAHPYNARRIFPGELDMQIDEQRFGGIARLYGRIGLERLASAHVAVVGIGGVGSWAAEALARQRSRRDLAVRPRRRLRDQHQPTDPCPRRQHRSRQGRSDGRAHPRHQPRLHGPCRSSSWSPSWPSTSPNSSTG